MTSVRFRVEVEKNRAPRRNVCRRCRGCGCGRAQVGFANRTVGLAESCSCAAGALAAPRAGAPAQPPPVPLALAECGRMPARLEEASPPAATVSAGACAFQVRTWARPGSTTEEGPAEIVGYAAGALDSLRACAPAEPPPAPLRQGRVPARLAGRRLERGCARAPGHICATPLCAAAAARPICEADAAAAAAALASPRATAVAMTAVAATAAAPRVTARRLARLRAEEPRVAARLSPRRWLRVALLGCALKHRVWLRAARHAEPTKLGACGHPRLLQPDRLAAR